jgi:DNA-binding MarR family transcriptional regulator
LDAKVNNEIFLISSLITDLIRRVEGVEKKSLYKPFNGLSIIEIDTIIVIGRNGTKNMSQIAKMLGVSSGTPTVTIDRLISKGYVIRKRDMQDRRQVFIQLSHKGDEVFENIISLKQKVSEKIFGILTDTEKKSCISVLTKLNNNFDVVYDAINFKIS